MKALLRWIPACIFVVALPLLIHTDTVLTIIVFSFLLGTVAVSYNLIFGYTGQLSMFHAASFGVGAYATYIAMHYWRASFWEGLIFGALLVAILSAVVGIICFRFRLREFYFAVVTLAMSEMLHLVALNWNDVTNGSLGINLTTKPTIWLPGAGTLTIQGTVAWYYVSALALVLTIVLCRRVVTSWMGRAFAAIRLNDELGGALGINVFRYKLIVFVVASTIAAVIGGLYAYYLGYIEPDFLSIDQSLAIIAMVLLGGRGAVAAPVVGALVLTTLPIVVHFNAEVHLMVDGLILILVILLMPQGIYGFVADRLRRLNLRASRAA